MPPPHKPNHPYQKHHKPTTHATTNKNTPSSPLATSTHHHKSQQGKKKKKKSPLTTTNNSPTSHIHPSPQSTAGKKKKKEKKRKKKTPLATTNNISHQPHPLATMTHDPNQNIKALPPWPTTPLKHLNQTIGSLTKQRHLTHDPYNQIGPLHHYTVNHNSTT